MSLSLDRTAAVPLPVRLVGAATAPATAQLARLATLEDVIRRPGFALLDVIVQDEYTHDVVVAAGELYLVFDST